MMHPMGLAAERLATFALGLAFYLLGWAMWNGRVVPRWLAWWAFPAGVVSWWFRWWSWRRRYGCFTPRGRSSHGWRLLER